MEQLLVALMRSELRRAESLPDAWVNSTSTLRVRRSQNDNPAGSSTDLENLVRSMLATPMPPATREMTRDNG
jgi:hypothetical protein